VRVNEPFGDSVNWDLIQSRDLEHGADPGVEPGVRLNTLGGALVITTRAASTAGSVDRGVRRVVRPPRGELEYGGAASASPTSSPATSSTRWLARPEREPGETGFRQAELPKQRHDPRPSYTGASNVLNGAQSIPVSFLESSARSRTPSGHVQERAFVREPRRQALLSDRQVLEASAYSRSLKSRTFSTNVNDGFDPALPIAPATARAEHPGRRRTAAGASACNTATSATQAR